jgi:Zn-dependent protease
VAAGLRFRIFGIPVHVDASFFLIAVLLGLGGGTLTFIVSWVVVVFVSVLLHELGHAVAFRIYGQQPRVVLQGMGGLTSGSGPLIGSRDIVVSLAGPLTGVLFLGVPAYFLQGPAYSASTWHLVLRELVFVNVIWSGVNLLPVLPLDGGQVTASVLRRFKGEDGQRLAYKVSIAVAGVAALLAYQLNYVFGALFAVFFVAQNYGSLRQDRIARQREPLVAGYQALLRDDLDAAVSTADALLATRPPPVPDVAAPAVELKAWARFVTGGAAAAASVLEAMPPGVAVNGFLTGSMALDEGRTNDALDAFAEAFVRSQSGPWSLIVARTIGRAGVVDELADRLSATPGAGAGALVHLQSHLFAVERYPEAARVGQRAFEAGAPEPAHVAYDVACSWARAARPDDALDWLERAAAAGLADASLVDDDPDLATIRGTPRYQAVVARMAN